MTSGRNSWRQNQRLKSKAPSNMCKTFVRLKNKSCPTQEHLRVIRRHPTCAKDLSGSRTKVVRLKNTFVWYAWCSKSTFEIKGTIQRNAKDLSGSRTKVVRLKNTFVWYAWCLKTALKSKAPSNMMQRVVRLKNKSCPTQEHLHVIRSGMPRYNSKQPSDVCFTSSRQAKRPPLEPQAKDEKS